MLFVFVLALCSFTTVKSCDVITAYACEDNSVTVTCPNNRVIDVYDAFYGRKNGYTCGPGDSSADCEAEGSEDKIVELCQDEPSCTVQGTVEAFGEACANVSKYAQIDYRCVSPVQYHPFEATACERKVVTCPNDHVIIVQDGFVGRDNADTCPGSGGNSNCKASDGLNVLKETCNNKQSCVLDPGSDSFADDCTGIDKYISFKYYCVKRPGTFQQKKAIACEHRASVTIKCPRGDVIIVTDGFYGRDDRNTCPGNVFTTKCKARTSLEILKRHCDNEQSCLVSASNSVFGDPCPRTNKLVKLDYYCVPSPTLTLNLAVACENQGSVDVGCPEGKVLSVIDGFYGRDDTTTCPGNVFTTDCNAAGSLKKLQGTCTNRQACTIKADNAIFGDPCPETNKLIKLYYYCV